MRMEDTIISWQGNGGDYVQLTTNNGWNYDNDGEDIIEEENEEEQSSNNHGDNYPGNKSGIIIDNNNRMLLIECFSTTKSSLIKIIFWLLGIGILVQ